MISEESLNWIKALNKFYKSGDLNDLPVNANRDNPYVFDALKKWKLNKRNKVVYSAGE
jgi:hypothetical protein